MEARDSFGYWVRRRRKSLDLTQEQLAERTGCALISLRKIEADERRPSSQMAKRLAQGLALPPSEWARFVAAATGRETVAWLERQSDIRIRHPGNLPSPLTSLIGRESELTQITTCLVREDVHLVTLTGPVGVGKTRLAIEAGRRLQKIRDGVYLVELASVRDASLVLPAIATMLGVREGRNSNLDLLLGDYLVDRRLVLILDNFEHLLSAASSISSLLTACPLLKIVVTSRARLHVYGEHELMVSPLSLPEPGNIVDAANSTAVRLFCARAQAARADFHLTPSLTPTVAAICRHLDGLPLAIELAAARIRVFSPQELLHRLNHHSHSSVPGLANPLPQLRVLENAISLSYGLLSPVQQVLLTRLAVFAGGFSLEAAQAIIGEPDSLPSDTDIADDINVLLDQSLLVRETATMQPLPAGGHCSQCPVLQMQEDAASESRFTMLETIREFAITRLQERGEQDQFRQRHADYFSQCAQRAAVQLSGPLQSLWLVWLERNNENLRAALMWLLTTHNTTPAAELSSALSGFWQRHGHYDEGRHWFTQVLADMVQYATPDMVRARTLQAAAVLAYRQGDWPIAQSWLAESWNVYYAAGNVGGQARVRFDQGWIALDQGNWDEAMLQNRESLRLARAAGDTLVSYLALTNLGWTHLCIGAYSEASPLFTEAHALAQQMQHTKGIAVSLTNLGWSAWYAGDAVRARMLAQSGLRLCCRLDERELMSECLELITIATAASGDLQRAARLGGAADSLRTALHVIRPATHHAAIALTETASDIRQQLSASDFDTAWQIGRGMRLEAMIEYALSCKRTSDESPM